MKKEVLGIAFLALASLMLHVHQAAGNSVLKMENAVMSELIQELDYQIEDLNNYNQVLEGTVDYYQQEVYDYQDDGVAYGDSTLVEVYGNTYYLIGEDGWTDLSITHKGNGLWEVDPWGGSVAATNYHGGHFVPYSPEYWDYMMGWDPVSVYILGNSW